MKCTLGRDEQLSGILFYFIESPRDKSLFQSFMNEMIIKKKI